MVAGNGVDNVFRLAVAFHELGSDDGVRAFDLVIERLADIVQQA